MSSNFVDTEIAEPPAVTVRFEPVDANVSPRPVLPDEIRVDMFASRCATTGRSSKGAAPPDIDPPSDRAVFEDVASDAGTRDEVDFIVPANHNKTI